MASATPSRAELVADAPRLNFTYTSYDDAPPLHKQVARIAINERLFPDEIIIKHRNLFPPNSKRRYKLDLVRRILTHDPIAEYVHEQKAMDAAMRREEEAELRKKMTKGRQKSIEKLVDSVEKKDMSVREAIASAAFFSDRHPDGEYVRRNYTKVDQTNTHVVSGDVLKAIKQRAADARVTGPDDIDRMAIDVNCAPSLPVGEEA